MSKFNSTLQKPKKSINMAGGESYNQSKELELISILLTSFVSDQFYRNSNDTILKLKELINQVDPLFAAKAAIFARDKFGMRSISHVLASEIASNLRGKEWAKNFYDKIVVRVDDMTEIVSYYLNNNTDKSNPKFPNSMKKGFASAFNRYNGYHFAKYRGEGKEVKLIDIVNLVHPIPTEYNAEALKNLVSGTLRNSDTWESKLSKAGQSEEGDVKKLKSEAWKDLIESKKIGIMALLKNLRNIINQSPDIIPSVCKLLCDEKLIINSRALPFRFSTAYEEVSKIGTSKEIRDILNALSKSMDISSKNIPQFDNTLFVIDTSRSMSGKPSEIASLFTAMFAKSNNCDVMTFDREANYISYNPSDSVMTIRNSFKFTGGGTNVKDVFIKANKPYENIVIISDMQSWIGHKSPSKEFNDYKIKFNCDPYVYSWDVAGYGTMLFPESKVFALSGFSEKVFDIMSTLKEDKRSLINHIKSIEI